MSLYATLEEAVDAAREAFDESQQGLTDDETLPPEQFNLQKYIMQDGDIMWQAEFLAQDGEPTDSLPFLTPEAAAAVYNGDYDTQELEEEWIKENTLYEWDDGEFQHVPQLDSEEGEEAANEWDDEDEYPGRDID